MGEEYSTVMRNTQPTQISISEVGERNTDGQTSHVIAIESPGSTPILRIATGPPADAAGQKGIRSEARIVLPYRSTLQVPFGSKRYLGSSPSKYATSRMGRDNTTVFTPRPQSNNMQPPHFKLPGAHELFRSISISTKRQHTTNHQEDAMDVSNYSVLREREQQESTPDVEIGAIDHHPTVDHMFGELPRSRSMTPFVFMHRQNELQSIDARDLERQGHQLAELAAMNHNVHKYLGALCQRLNRVENENEILRETVAAYQPNKNVRDGDGSETEQEEIPVLKTPRKKMSLLPTPDSPDVQMTLHPPKLGTPTSRLALTRRSANNLSKQMIHSKSQFPDIPLTDVEVVVYFYNSVARPKVAARLYGRDFGPKKISDALNEHRDIDPPYLRNSATVKCINALKRGAQQYGPEWEETTKKVFSTANVAQATKMCHITTEEGDAYDADILDIANGIKTFPEIGTSGGIFTQCVRFCADHQLRYPLSKITTILEAIQGGATPEPIDVSAHNLPPTPRTPKNGNPSKSFTYKVEHEPLLINHEDTIENENGPFEME